MNDKFTAPDWLIERMERLKQQRPPTSDEVNMQLKSSAEFIRNEIFNALRIPKEYLTFPV